MKALIVAADAITPEYVVEKRKLFPNINNIMEHGAMCTYSGYVQRGYSGSYSSGQNWVSIYTGLPPKEHGKNRQASLKMRDICEFEPFWQILNKNGLTTGLWSFRYSEPIEIDGYIISSRYEPIFTPQDIREAPRTISVSEKDKQMLRLFDSAPPPRLYPKTLKQHGLTFEKVKENPELVDIVANEATFQPMLDNFEAELRFWFNAMTKAQRDIPVDVVYFFTPSTDILTHFILYSDNNPILIKAYQLLDNYIGRFVEEFKPDITVLMSDHGQQNFKYIVDCSNPDTQREAFSERDKAIWLKNGYIAFEALNGGLLFTTHTLKGVFIASGNGIKNVQVSEMRTLDIYPTLLEIFGIEIPEGRNGFVVDIFNRPVTNSGKLLKSSEIIYASIALIQAHEVSITDIILNELYLEKRFARITVVGEAKYEEIFRNNPRVFDFVSYRKFDASDFDEVFCGFYNKASKQMNHIRVK